MRYAFRLRQGPKTIARASLNDLPFFRAPSSAFQDTARACDHLLVPGENVLALELWDGPPSPDSPEHRGPVHLTVEVVETEEKLAQIAWPALALAAGQKNEELALPWAHAVRFTIPEEHPRAFYEGRPAERIPAEGTPDLRGAVRRIHDALSARNARAFVGEFQLKLEEQRRFYGDSPELDKEGLVGAYERRFADALAVEPIGDEDLTFEARAGGRVAYVTRRDGRPVLSARGVADPGQSFELDPLLVREGPKWSLLA